MMRALVMGLVVAAGMTGAAWADDEDKAIGMRFHMDAVARCRMAADQRVELFRDKRTQAQTDAQWGRAYEACTILEDASIAEIVRTAAVIDVKSAKGIRGLPCFDVLKDRRVTMPYGEIMRCLQFAG